MLLSSGTRLLVNSAEIETQIQNETRKKTINSILSTNNVKKSTLQHENADFESMIRSEIKSIGNKM
jgi:hypothetical protein